MKAIYIPNGPKNLATLFPDVNFPDIAEYYLEVMDSDINVVATTSRCLMDTCDHVRIHFLNYLGTVDAIDFMLATVDHDAKSDSSQVPEQYPLNKPDHAINRFNVSANDTYTVKSVAYDESAQAWLTELLDSPVAWMQWRGTQGQPDSYIPIVISDQTLHKQKEDDRFYYEVDLQFTLSHPKFIIRN